MPIGLYVGLPEVEPVYHGGTISTTYQPGPTIFAPNSVYSGSGNVPPGPPPQPSYLPESLRVSATHVAGADDLSDRRFIDCPGHDASDAARAPVRDPTADRPPIGIRPRTRRRCAGTGGERSHLERHRSVWRRDPRLERTDGIRRSSGPSFGCLERASRTGWPSSVGSPDRLTPRARKASQAATPPCPRPPPINTHATRRSH